MITKKDILSALGAEIHEDNFLTGMLVGIGVGAIVGGAVAMLFAPKTGTEMRQMIGERVPEIVDKAKQKINSLTGNGNKAETTTPGTGVTKGTIG
jgi:gas vesicle protein